ncbi:hypothetical protein [Pacificitalea manganoxidans]|uniref:hypothetical protein n=1 Tax=Pacificitalea manganoxidans TaxID=1411902 RepID=UPI0018E0A085|nr:hypothetical protein [Pacificitalea manganoxidans]MDR6307541.1 hypothetical protein [Pacificitalea manganoxidans]
MTRPILTRPFLTHPLRAVLLGAAVSLPATLPPGPAAAQIFAPDTPQEDPLPDNLPDTAPEAEPDADMGEGLGLLEEGGRMLFQGLMDEMRPAMEGMARDLEPALRRMVDEMGPALIEMSRMIRSVDDYHAPEKLPNGDIILRRKTPLEDDPAPDDLGPDERPGGEGGPALRPDGAIDL